MKMMREGGTPTLTTKPKRSGPRFQRRIDADEHFGLANVMEDEIEIAYRLCGWNVERKRSHQLVGGATRLNTRCRQGMVLLRKDAGRKRIESRGEMSESAERIKPLKKLPSPTCLANENKDGMA